MGRLLKPLSVVVPRRDGFLKWSQSSSTKSAVALGDSMDVNCPFHHERVGKLNKNVTLVNRLVIIHGGVCDRSDKCPMDGTCPFHDNSREATRRFMKACAYSHTMEGMLQDAELKRQFKERFEPVPS